ncbi:LolA family protein [Microvirga massiliensis]|uniref:LolA family protein n=1 Tax=Microvirga massiliensis TaxID=1033741 RepID=UPI00069C8DE2|nr:outer-membrane lipoprotein carrier protein LolA [Microvirga massiliensis]
MRVSRPAILTAAILGACSLTVVQAEPIVSSEVLFQAPRIGSDTASHASFTLSAAPPSPSFEPRRQPAPVQTIAEDNGPEPVVLRAAVEGEDSKPARQELSAMAGDGVAPSHEAPAPTLPVPPLPPPAPPRTQIATALPVAAPVNITPAAATPRRPAPKVENLSDAEIIARANQFFMDLGATTAEFTQIGGDGRRMTGTLYLQRPGRLRFQYDRPATIEIIADGNSVAVKDRKLDTQDIYPIWQTPLKFLLREKVNLGQDIRVTGIWNDGDAVRIQLEDRSTLGGTSKIMLFFDPKVEKLTQWRITDPQGFQTIVMLSNVERVVSFDSALFIINYHARSGGGNR